MNLRTMRTWILLFSFLLAGPAWAQTDSTKTPPAPPAEAPFKRFPSIPPFQLLLTDSTTIYSRANLPGKKAVLFMIFSPECSHCQHEAEELVQHRDKLEEVQVVMVTLPSFPLAQVREFISKYQLAGLPNVVVGRDHTWFFPSFYNIGNLPYLALYDRKGNLIHHFEGNLGMKKVADIFRKAK